jgi:hypothetical protein
VITGVILVMCFVIGLLATVAFVVSGEIGDTTRKGKYSYYGGVFLLLLCAAGLFTVGYINGGPSP